MKKTVVINLIGAPCAGKSTLASELFSTLKRMKLNVELVSEFAKELVWEERHETIKNELYLFAKQHHRLFRLLGKVDIIVTDRPLILSCFYNQKYGDGSLEYDKLVMHEINKMDNINFFLTRTTEYQPKGRLQTKEESDEFSQEIKDMLVLKKVKFIDVTNNTKESGMYPIMKYLEELLILKK